MKLFELNNESSLFTATDNGDLYYKDYFLENHGDKEEALELTPDVVIGPKGVEYVSNDSGIPRIDEVYNVDIGPEHVVGNFLYKATENTSSPQIPGFMTDSESVKQYLEGGSRGRHYGGGNLIKAFISKIKPLQNVELIHTANFGYVAILPGTPSILDFGDDGILVLQEIDVELVK
jgi:hypothetical protein